VKTAPTARTELPGEGAGAPKAAEADPQAVAAINAARPERAMILRMTSISTDDSRPLAADGAGANSRQASGRRFRLRMDQRERAGARRF
jgi:hypothetical protein